MKKLAGVFFFLLGVTSAFADSIILNNQALNPAHDKKSKMAIQWVNSAKDVEEENTKLKRGENLNPNSLQNLNHAGKIQLIIPKKAEYFRVLVWTKAAREPDLLTNWVDVVPKKTYTLNKDLLVPLVLISGMGC